MAPLKLSYTAPWLLGLLGCQVLLRTELHGPFETELHDSLDTWPSGLSVSFKNPFEIELHDSLKLSNVAP